MGSLSRKAFVQLFPVGTCFTAEWFGKVNTREGIDTISQRKVVRHTRTEMVSVITDGSRANIEVYLSWKNTVLRKEGDTVIVSMKLEDGTHEDFVRFKKREA